MPKSVTLYNVFVASPSDVRLERDSLEEIIKEINLTTANILGIKLDLVNWESNTYPSFGLDSQDVINSQINDDYDIFIGIMWSKFGTPTLRSDSGTKEEFLRAYEKWKNNKNDVKLMFYFKNAPVPIDNINIEQIQFIREFKSELQEKGGLYSQYDDVEQFNKLLRLHINKAITDLVKTKNSSVNKIESKVENNITNTVIIKEENVEELGFYENIEIANKMFIDCWIPVNNMTDYLTELTQSFNDKTTALDKLVTASNETKIRESKSLIDETAEDMLNFVRKTNAELPNFRDLYSKGFNAFTSAFTIWKNFDSENEDLINSKKSILTLKEGLIICITNMKSFMQSINNLPTMTTAMIKAKRQTVETINKQIKEFTFALELIEEFENDQ